MNDQFRRFTATEKTRERYVGRRFNWRDGATCLHMAHFHLIEMGHTNLPRIPNFGSALSAKRALTKNGWNDVDDMLGQFLPTIAPASARLGDLAVLEGSDGMGAIVVNAGQKWFGWSETNAPFSPLVVFQIRQAFRG